MVPVVGCFQVHDFVGVTIGRSIGMSRVLIFIAGGIVGYIASGWVEGFMEKKIEEKKEVQA